VQCAQHLNGDNGFVLLSPAVLLIQDSYMHNVFDFYVYQVSHKSHHHNNELASFWPSE
jgi:hypothetical protein